MRSRQARTRAIKKVEKEGQRAGGRGRNRWRSARKETESLPSMSDVPAWIGSKGESEEVEATASTREDMVVEVLMVGGEEGEKEEGRDRFRG